jgi:RNA-directed DNA polymerase
MTKPYNIPKRFVWQAYLSVKANGGSAGIDRESLEKFEENLSNNLYKLWNRMCSGSYFPPPVKAVPIPKKTGGVRILGVPTVADRIAQTVVKQLLEPVIDPIFHANSYGYRPGRSAHDAVAMVRRRSWEYDWVIEFDIKGLFDNIDHSLLMRALRKHCKTPWVLMYVERWLKAPMQMPEGNLVMRTCGTPQGGVVSPLLANLFLHYVFDKWVEIHLPSVRFCRYADDGIIHCRSKAQAEFALTKIRDRFLQCNLELHPQKTKIVYCKDINRKMDYSCVQFTFLGYTFRPRKSVDKIGRVYVNFAPAVSRSALKAMRQTIRGWHIQLKFDKSLSDLSSMFNPILRGWYQYYGKFHSSAMYALWNHFNGYLTRWLMRKYKRLARHKTRAGHALNQLAIKYPNAFVHWNLGIVAKTG